MAGGTPRRGRNAVAVYGPGGLLFVVIVAASKAFLASTCSPKLPKTEFLW